MSGFHSSSDGFQDVDFRTDVAGIPCPNPFWLGAGPSTRTGGQLMRAFDTGWGGAVWCTIGDGPRPASPALSAVRGAAGAIVGLHGVDAVSLRPAATDLREIRETKRRHPRQALVVSVSACPRREAWQSLVRRVCECGADGVELPLDGPRIPRTVEWVKQAAHVPVLVRLAPGAGDLGAAARAAADAGADGLTLIGPLPALAGVDLERLRLRGHARGLGGPGVRPLALHHFARVSADPDLAGLSLSGAGGITTWKDALEFVLLGASSVQLRTAVMLHGYRIVEDLTDGLAQWMREHGYRSVRELAGVLRGRLGDSAAGGSEESRVARIDGAGCIRCNLCHVACADGGHHCIEPAGADGRGLPHVREAECRGCGLCAVVCPVEGCVSLVPAAGPADPRALFGRRVRMAADGARRTSA